MSPIRRLLAVAALCAATFSAALADLPDTIDRIKPSIVVVGTYNKTASPPFTMYGTGFVVGDGNQVATNAHVARNDTPLPEGTSLVILARTPGGELQPRRARIVTTDKDHDLAVLRIEGAALPKLALRNSDSVREGLSIAFTGFPIGGALGFSPVTHHGIVSSITPIAIPSPTAQQLNEKIIHRIKNGAFRIFQLDATAYPGNSGSPMFDAETGEVIGIINMVFVKSTKESVLSQPSGISYAIPANHLAALLNAER